MDQTLCDMFKTSIWKSKIHYPKKQEIIQLYESEYLKNPSKIPDGWKCDLYSSFSYNSDDYKSGYIPEDLISLIEEKLNEFFDEEFTPTLQGTYYISNIWYNIYKKNQYQELHSHGTCLFSGCYYLKFNKDYHEQTFFCNPNFNINFNKVENESYFYSNMDCEEDDIIIFPSNLKHGTKGIVKDCDESRITISFNIDNDFLLA